MHEKVADGVLYTTVVPRVFMRRVKRVARRFHPCGDHFIVRDVEEMIVQHARMQPLKWAKKRPNCTCLSNLSSTSLRAF